MAKYKYRCPGCEREQTISHSMLDDTKRICERCNKQMYKIIQVASVIYNCDGFYCKENNK